MISKVSSDSAGVRTKRKRAPVIDGHPLDGPEYALRWPKELFLREAEALRRRHDGAQERLFSEAFVSSVPAAAVRRQLDLNPTLLLDVDREHENDTFEQVLTHADVLEVAPPPRLVWRQRRRPANPAERVLTIDGVAKDYAKMVQGMYDAGYLARQLLRPCLSGTTIPRDPSDVLQHVLGWRPAWPLDPAQLTSDPDNLFDLIELLHEWAARPRTQVSHAVPVPRQRITGDGPRTCLHHTDLASPIGQAIYRFRINDAI